MPASRTARESRISGAGAVRRIGFSPRRTTSGNEAATSAPVTVTRVRSTPSAAAIWSWKALSSKRASSKPTPKARSSCGTCRRASSAVIDESRPPER